MKGECSLAEEEFKEGEIMFELWVSVALLGIWSSVGVMYRNSKKARDQLEQIVRLLAQIAESKVGA